MVLLSLVEVTQCPVRMFGFSIGLGIVFSSLLLQVHVYFVVTTFF